MEKERDPKTPSRKAPEQGKERRLKETLSKPPKDKREIVIGPTNKSGPDITFG